MDTEKREVTIIDVANYAGVSKATVGRVIGNYGNVSPKTREIVMNAIEELGYSPNAIAQGLRAKSTKTIGVVVGSIKNNFCNQLLYAVEKVAIQKGYDVLFGNSSEKPLREVEMLRNLKARRVDGVVLISAVTNISQIPKQDRSLYRDIPIVLADRKVEGLHLNLVTSNNYDGSYFATKRLISNGHEKIGVIYYGNVSTIMDRFDAWQDAMKDAKISWTKKRLLITQEMDDLSIERICDYLKANQDMTSVIVFNNSILGHLLLAMQDLGIRVGEDLSIISWDDDDLNKIMGIDTMNQEIEEIGRLAAERIFYMIENNNRGGVVKTTLDTYLQERNSCKRIN